MIQDILNQDLLSQIKISFDMVILSLICSALSGALVKWLYTHYGRSLNNRSNFSDIFVLLAVVTSVVIIIVKYSLALSLGLVGALSIVRFRAAIKEPEELVYLFLIIALGLAFGANQYLAGFSLTFFAMIVIILQPQFNPTVKIKKNKTSMLLVTGNANAFESWYETFNLQWGALFESVILRDLSNSNGNVTATYQISLAADKNTYDQFIDKILHTTEVNIELISDIVLPE